MLIPRGNSLKGLVEHVSNTNVGDITAKMRTMRVAATVPIYTLRMTLLLPNKLQAVCLSIFTQYHACNLVRARQRCTFLIVGTPTFRQLCFKVPSSRRQAYCHQPGTDSDSATGDCYWEISDGKPTNLFPTRESNPGLHVQQLRLRPLGQRDS